MVRHELSFKLSITQSVINITIPKTVTSIIEMKVVSLNMEFY